MGERHLGEKPPRRAAATVTKRDGRRWGSRLAAGVGALAMGYAAVFGAVYGAMVGTNCVFGCAPPTVLDVLAGGSMILVAAAAGAGAAVLLTVAVGRPRWRGPAARVGVVGCAIVAVAMAVLSRAG